MSKFSYMTYGAAQVGINSQAMNASADMNPIAVMDGTTVVIDMTIVNATGAALDLTCTLQRRADGSDNWRTMQTRSIAAGVETWSDRTWAKTTAAAAATYRYSMTIDDIEGGQFRLASIVTTTGGATDLLTFDLVTVKTLVN